MRLPEYIVKINGKYFAGFDYGNTVGKTSHSGWSPQPNELEAMITVDKSDDARVIEGNIELKSKLNAIYDRVRFGGLDLQSLEVTKKKTTA
jgi:hypothetical protein